MIRNLEEAREFDAKAADPEFLDRLNSHACGSADVATLALQALGIALAAVERLEANVERLQDDMRCTCESPAEDCQCCGCLAASERADRENADERAVPRG